MYIICYFSLFIQCSSQGFCFFSSSRCLRCPQPFRSILLFVNLLPIALATLSHKNSNNENSNSSGKSNCIPYSWLYDEMTIHYLIVWLFSIQQSIINSRWPNKPTQFAQLDETEEYKKTNIASSLTAIFDYRFGARTKYSFARASTFKNYSLQISILMWG